MKMHIAGLDPLKAVSGRISRFFRLFNSGSLGPVASMPGLIEWAEMTYLMTLVQSELGGAKVVPAACARASSHQKA
jgi:hypothetical protein